MCSLIHANTRSFRNASALAAPVLSSLLLQVMLVSSKMGSIGDGRTGGNLYGYRMSKAAANCAGATLARDLKEDEIMVGLIHPGAVSRSPKSLLSPHYKHILIFNRNFLLLGLSISGKG